MPIHAAWAHADRGRLRRSAGDQQQTRRREKTKPDFLFILPWNLREEIAAQNAYIREWGGRFVVPIPDVKVF